MLEGQLVNNAHIEINRGILGPKTVVALNEFYKQSDEKEERKKGKWIEEEKGIHVTSYRCSECGRTVMDDTGYDVSKDYPFCNCGADMRGEEDG